ncbi:MAG: hypothetical protein AABZ06_03265 [Bdellovibrionota bacterium]
MANSIIEDSWEGSRVGNYRRLMRLLGVLYALAGAWFFLAPDSVLQLINLGPKYFNLAFVIPIPADRFWLVLAVSMMAMLSALSFLSAEDPANRGYPFVHLLSKLVSLGGFIAMFFLYGRYFAYLVGAFVDLLLALIVLWDGFVRRPGAKFVKQKAEA